MRQGDVFLAAVPQADHQWKLRPVLLLREMPPFRDWLVCSISTQLHHEVTGFDDLLRQCDPDFVATGLKETSLCRLGHLNVLPTKDLRGRLGEVASARHRSLLARLALHLSP
jgi:mRNA interferase MazF